MGLERDSGLFGISSRSGGAPSSTGRQRIGLHDNKRCWHWALHLMDVLATENDVLTRLQPLNRVRRMEDDDRCNVAGIVQTISQPKLSKGDWRSCCRITDGETSILIWLWLPEKDQHPIILRKGDIFVAFHCRPSFDNQRESCSLILAPPIGKWYCIDGNREDSDLEAQYFNVLQRTHFAALRDLRPEELSIDFEFKFRFFDPQLTRRTVPIVRPDFHCLADVGGEGIPRHGLLFKAVLLVACWIHKQSFGAIFWDGTATVYASTPVRKFYNQWLEAASHTKHTKHCWFRMDGILIDAFDDLFLRYDSSLTWLSENHEEVQNWYSFYTSTCNGSLDRLPETRIFDSVHGIRWRCQCGFLVFYNTKTCSTCGLSYEVERCPVIM